MCLFFDKLYFSVKNQDSFSYCLLISIYTLYMKPLWCFWCGYNCKHFFSSAKQHTYSIDRCLYYINISAFVEITCASCEHTSTHPSVHISQMHIVITIVMPFRFVYLEQHSTWNFLCTQVTMRENIVPFGSDRPDYVHILICRRQVSPIHLLSFIDLWGSPPKKY